MVRTTPRRTCFIFTYSRCGSSPFTLATPPATAFADLDQFLRDIWLECCGHLSSFPVQGMNVDAYPYEASDTDMDHPLGEARRMFERAGLSVRRATTHRLPWWWHLMLVEAKLQV